MNGEGTGQHTIMLCKNNSFSNAINPVIQCPQALLEPNSVTVVVSQLRKKKKRII